MKNTPSRRRLLTLSVALVLAGSALGACGSDDDDSSTDTAATAAPTTAPTTAPPTTSPTATTVGGTSADGDAPSTDAGGDASAAFCDAVIALDATDSPGGPTDPTAEDWKAFAEQIGPLVDTLESDAPTDLADSVAVMRATVGAMATGDGSSTESPEFATANLAIEQSVRENCPVNPVDITAEEGYHVNMPEAVPAGPLSVQFTNESTEPHVILFVRKRDDVTDDKAFVDEYLNAAFTGGPEAMAQYADVDISGGGPFAPVGGSSMHLTDFEPGDYIWFCPIPSGENGEGPSHYTLGMIGEFTAEG